MSRSVPIIEVSLRFQAARAFLPGTRLLLYICERNAGGRSAGSGVW